MSDPQPRSRAGKHRVLLPRPVRSAIQPRRQSLPVKPSHVRSRLSRNLYTGCHVSSCSVPNCSSYIHQQLPWLVRSRSNGAGDLPELLQTLFAPDHNLAAPTATPKGMSEDFEFKELFHQYLMYDMPRIVALMSPPSSTQAPAKFIMIRTKFIAELGSSAPVYFLLFVSMAHILELVRREQLEAERVSAKLYSRLTKLLRERLDVYKPSEVSNLILAILAMSSFDMSLGNRNAVCCHHSALAQLVSQVGLQYLGHSLSLVLSYDRLMSAFTIKPPLYAKMPDRSLLRRRDRPMKYGSAIKRIEENSFLDNNVRTACLDLCEAVEIVEAQNWTFRPERQYSPYTASEVQYLYFLREVIQNTCINLHARDIHNQQVSRPILFGVMIIQYILLGKNELTWYSTTAADRLYHALSTCETDHVWHSQDNLLCWLMCVLILVPKPWRQRTDALELFTNWMETKFHVRRHQLDRKMIFGLCDIKAFIWCEPELNDMLDVALKDIRSSDAPVTNGSTSRVHSHNLSSSATLTSDSSRLSEGTSVS